MRPTEEIERLNARIAELEAWKESALAVEREWDAQAVARMLNVPLGASIRSAIAKRVPILVLALEMIADHDYRGNRSPESTVAIDALRRTGIRQ